MRKEHRMGVGALTVSASARAGWLALVVGLAACSAAPPRPSQQPMRSRALPVALPDSAGWGVHVLAVEQDSTGRLWAGTYGQGIYLLDREARDDSTARASRRPEGRRAEDAPPPRGRQGPQWRRIPPGDSTSISSDIVNAIAFTRKGDVWYGTVGNGFGQSTDGGATWRNWTFDQLGPRWLYVAPNGIHVHADTVFIATSDGLRITRDGGTRWTCVVSTRRPATPDPTCTDQVQGLPSEYLLALEVDVHGRVWAGGLDGLALSPDGGRSWRTLGAAEGLPQERIRAVVMNTDSSVWVATENAVYVDSTRRENRYEFKQASIRPPGFARLPGAVRAMVASPGRLPPTLALSNGLAAGDTETNTYRLYYLAAAETYRPAGDLWAVVWWGPPLWPIGAATTGLNLTLAGDYRPEGALSAQRASPPEAPQRPWLQRPIDGADGNPYVDALHRYGATMGGRYPQDMGIAFNNPSGTPVRAVANGVVVFAGTAEGGSNTVAIRHDREVGGKAVYSAYHHNASIDVAVGENVRAGLIIARVGNTGGVRNTQVHLEVHLASDDGVVGPAERVAATTVNPQLWIEPLPGAGVVVGRVLDGEGRPVAGARVRGLVLPYPVETPFSHAETYADRANADPEYGENFAVGDVPVGEYLLGVDIEGERVWRRVRVEAGRVTRVEFRPN